MLQPHALKYFAEVARHGSLRMAADLQEIAPSALSRQITQLEKFLDVFTLTVLVLAYLGLNPN